MSFNSARRIEGVEADSGTSVLRRESVPTAATSAKSGGKIKNAMGILAASIGSL